jgi:DNA-binding response OmpR family regulator
MDSPKRILLIEDDQFISRAYQDGLQRAGFEVKVIHDGDQALTVINEYQPDLVLLDLIMPGKDGFEVLSELKNKSAHAPVLVLSNLGQASDVNKAKELGATDYLTKSNVSLKDIIAKVGQYLSPEN